MYKEEQKMAEHSALRKEFERDFFVFYRGRIKRSDYIVIFLSIGFLLNLSSPYIPFDDYGVLFWVFEISILYISASLCIKRLHDVGLTGWLVLPLFFLSFAYDFYLLLGFSADYMIFWSSFFCSTLFSLLIAFWPSQKKDNKYGPYYSCGYLGSFEIWTKKQKPL